MSRSSNVWDNAMMESVFTTLKTERTAWTQFAPRLAAQADVFDFLERLYNPIRRHSTLGYLSLMDFERAVASPRVHGIRTAQSPTREMLHTRVDGIQVGFHRLEV